MSYKDVVVKKPWGKEYLVYENENLGSPRQQTKPEELEKLKNLLETKPKPKRVKKAKTKKISIKNIPPRTFFAKY